MQLKNLLYKLMSFIFIWIYYNNFAFGFTFNNQDHSNFDLNKNNVKTLMFLNKNECFSFLKFNKLFFSKTEKIIIGNNHFIGILKDNKFRMFYIVKSKDTLYSIAKNSGHNYYELSRFNFIKKPDKIIVGQKIWVGDFFVNANNNNCLIINSKENLSKKYSSCATFFKNPLSISHILRNNLTNFTESTKICFICNRESINTNYFNKESFFSFNNWYWPVKNEYIQYFYNSPMSNKQIEISGVKGEPIFAAAAGEVVYITDSFKKYGRLIIIRHNENYLSIYAFNDSILVKQKDKVYAKQQIATMGLSPGKKLAQLYFEIRYQGEPINPLNVLPKKNQKK